MRRERRDFGLDGCFVQNAERFGPSPVDSLVQTFAIVTGTAIVVAFAIYILAKWRAFE